MSRFGGYLGWRRESVRIADRDAADLSQLVYGTTQPGWSRKVRVLNVNTPTVTCISFDNHPIVFEAAPGERYKKDDLIDIKFDWDEGYRLYSSGKRYRLEWETKTMYFPSLKEAKTFCQMSEMEEASLQIVDIKYSGRHRNGKKYRY